MTAHKEIIVPNTEVIHFSEVQFKPVIGKENETAQPAPRRPRPLPIPPVDPLPIPPVDPLPNIPSLPNPFDPPSPPPYTESNPDSDSRHSHEPRRPSPLRSSFTAESLQHEEFLASLPPCLKPMYPLSPSLISLVDGYVTPLSSPAPSTCYHPRSSSDDSTPTANERPRRITFPELSTPPRSATGLGKKPALNKSGELPKNYQRERACSLSSLFDKTPKGTPNTLLLNNHFVCDRLPPAIPIYVNRLPPPPRA